MVNYTLRVFAKIVCAWTGYPVSLYTPKECYMNQKGIPVVPRSHTNLPLTIVGVSTDTRLYSTSTLQLASCDRRFVLLDVEEKRIIRPIMESPKRISQVCHKCPPRDSNSIVWTLFRHSDLRRNAFNVFNLAFLIDTE